MADDTAPTAGKADEADEAEAVEGDEVVEVVDDSSDIADDTAEGTAAVEGDQVETVERRMSHLRLATIFGLIALLAVSGLAGWLGYRAYDSHRADVTRKDFLAAGKQVVLDLTTIDVDHVDQQTQRILDSATGTFYDDFERRAQPFAQVVKELKSKTEGSINEAGVESASETDAQILVAVTVKTSIAGQPPQPIRAFRMRISVQKIGDDVKVSEVKYVS